jgi:hypothetical protein
MDQHRGWESPKKLHEVEKQIIDWLMDRIPSLACPICSQSSWNISGPARVSTYPRETGSAVRHFPVVPVACRVCANTLLFNARIMGVSARDLAEWERTIEADPEGQAE